MSIGNIVCAQHTSRRALYTATPSTPPLQTTTVVVPIDMSIDRTATYAGAVGGPLVAGVSGYFGGKLGDLICKKLGLEED